MLDSETLNREVEIKLEITEEVFDRQEYEAELPALLL